MTGGSGAGDDTAPGASVDGDETTGGKRSDTAGIVLAAGAGRRLGRPKALLMVGGVRLVDRAIGLLAAGGCAPVAVVAGAVALDAGALEATLRRAQPDSATDVQVVRNSQWTVGIGSSLRSGLAWCDRLVPTADAAVVTLVDQPCLGPAAVRRLRGARAGGAVVAVATYAGRRANPVLIGREAWDGVAELAEGDVGARAWMRTHPELVTEVECNDTGDPADIDVPGDLLAAERRLREGAGGEH